MVRLADQPTWCGVAGKFHRSDWGFNRALTARAGRWVDVALHWQLIAVIIHQNWGIHQPCSSKCATHQGGNSWEVDVVNPLGLEHQAAYRVPRISMFHELIICKWMLFMVDFHHSMLEDKGLHCSKPRQNLFWLIRGVQSRWKPSVWLRRTLFHARKPAR